MLAAFEFERKNTTRSSVVYPSVSANLRNRKNVAFGSKAALTAPKCDFRYSLETGLNSDITACPKGAK